MSMLLYCHRGLDLAFFCSSKMKRASRVKNSTELHIKIHFGQVIQSWPLSFSIFLSSKDFFFSNVQPQNRRHKNLCYMHNFTEVLTQKTEHNLSYARMYLVSFATLSLPSISGSGPLESVEAWWVLVTTVTLCFWCCGLFSFFFRLLAYNRHVTFFVCPDVW